MQKSGHGCNYSQRAFRTDNVFLAGNMNFLESTGRIRPKDLPLVAIAVSIAVLLTFWEIVPGGAFNQSENSDYINYYLPVAQNIVHGEGVTLHGNIALNYPVGYPIIVAGCLYCAKLFECREELILRLSVVLCFALCALLIYALAKKIWKPPGALLASTLWSCYPIVLWAAKNPNTELPFSAFFYAALVCMLSGRSAGKRAVVLFFIAGILCGIAMLIRPIAIGLGILFAVLILGGRAYQFRKKIALALCLIAGNALAVLPWELWVYSKTHEIVPLCRGQQPFSLFDGLTFAVWNPDPAAHRLGAPVPPDVKNLMNELVRKYAHRIPSQTITSKEIAGIMAGEFKKRPVTVIKLIVIKAARSWYGTNSNRLESLIMLVQAAYVACLLWASVLMWRKRPDCRFLLIAGMVVGCYFWGMAAMVLSIVRYMMPVLGALVVFFPAIPHFLFNRRRDAHDRFVKNSANTAS
jgi:hypothetical protein